MRLRSALPLLTCCAWLAVAGSPAATAEVAVYGLELEVDEERERLLIFADAPLDPRIIPVDERTLMIALPGAVLDPSAPTRISPVTQGTVVRVTAFERAAEADSPEVRVVVQRRPGAPPRVETRASVIALDFEPRARLRSPVAEESVEVSYRGAPLVRVVTDLARATEESLVFDDSLAGGGSVTIEGPKRVSRAEALAMLDSILLMRGFAAVPAPGGVRKILPIGEAQGPWVSEGALPDRDVAVTTLLRLHSARAEDMLAALEPFLGAQTLGVVFEPTNSLILSGASSRLRRLRSAIEALDEIETGQPLIWKLQYGDAATIADRVQSTLGEDEVPHASIDARLNALLLRVRPGSVARARALVDRLDRPATGRGELNVIRLQYADPARLVEQLHALREGGFKTRKLDAAERGIGLQERRAGLRAREYEIAADLPTRSLVVRADWETFTAVLDVVRQLDRVPPSVRVEVTVATLDLDDRLDLGADFLVPTLTNPKQPDDLIATVFSNPSAGGIQTLPSSDRPFVAAFMRAPLLITLIDPITGNPFLLPPIPRESASITINGREVRTETLVRPTLLLTSGEEHEIFAGDNIPIPVAQTLGEDQDAVPTQLRQNIERQDVGTGLRLLPTVGEQGGVVLELDVEVTSLGESSAGAVEEVGPSIRKLEVQSVIRLRHGEVAVVATQAQPITRRAERGVPWLKDIPILGWAFRTTSDENVNRHLLVAVQAQIVRPEVRALSRALGEKLSEIESARREDVGGAEPTARPSFP